jgi:UrcA family protein
MTDTRRAYRTGAIISVIGAAAVMAGFAGRAAGDETIRHRNLIEQATVVDASELDLADASDAEVLYRRIQRAAVTMCRDVGIEWGVKRVLQRRKCIAAAVDDAVTRADAPLLTALHHGGPERMAGL